MPPARSPLTIGASDVVAICGFSGYNSPFDVALRISGRTDWGVSSPIAEWGNDMESSILAHWQRDNMIDLPIRGKSYVHPEYEFLAATPDGINEEHPVIVDAKNMHWTQAARFADGLPDDYTIQGTWQIGIYNAAAEVEGRKKLFTAIFHAAIGNDIPKSYYVDFDQSLFQKLMQRVFEFREQVARNDFDFPEMELPRTSPKEKIILTAKKRQEGILKRYHTISANIKELSEDRKALGEQIKGYIGTEANGIAGEHYKATLSAGSASVKYAEVVKAVVAKYKIPINEIEEIKAAHRGAKSEGRLSVKLLDEVDDGDE